MNEVVNNDKTWAYRKTSLVGIARDHLVLPLAVAGRVPCASSFTNNSFCSSGVFLTLKIGPLLCEQKGRGEGKAKEQPIQVLSK